MSFLREHSVPIVFSVLLHGLIAAALLSTALISFQHAPPDSQPLPIDAVVVDSQVLRSAQRAVADQQAAAAAAAQAAVEARQAEQVKQAEQAARAADEAARSAAAAKAEEVQKAEQERAADLKRVEDAQRAEQAKRVEQTKAAEEAKRAEQAKAEEAKRAEETKRAEEAKRVADAKAKEVEDAKRAADQKAKVEREAELRRQLADEEHAAAVQSSPLRDQYIARLQARIQNAWIRPPSAGSGLDCLVQVTQLPGGEVTGAEVTQCNGDAAMRDSIKNAVYRASPLPAPPDPALFSRTFTLHFHPDQ
jgi:colicin import membrane protein